MIITKSKAYGVIEMYNSFISESKEAYKIKERDIAHYKHLLNKIKFYIEGRKDIIQNSFGICIYNYWEWNTDEPDDNNKLLNDVSNLYNEFSKYKLALHRTDYLEFVKYIKIIRKINLLENQLVRINNRSSISFREFREYIKRYYQQINRELLYGRIYNFSNGIGNLLVERIATSTAVSKYGKSPKKYPDWQATKKAKAELIAKGLKPYDRDEEELYKKCNKEYDGVRYTVYKELEYSCRVMLCDRHFKTSHISLFKTSTTKIHESQENILKRCKTVNDIINLEYDLKCRLSLISKVDFSYTQKFIRNDEQKSVISRKYCSTIRQRL